MLRIPCPVCGLRDHSEFTYRSGISPDKQRPSEDETNIELWCDYLFIPTNPRGVHREYWHHAYGCRQWLVVERNTLNHEIAGAVLARHADPELPEDGT
ncbi:MAG: sarcosine oxidase subunit delta [Gammaproteobacteria bacterium]|nr:sarcosine oxidase subunit delta [Gammaproteobacteria bacterium]